MIHRMINIISPNPNGEVIIIIIVEDFPTDLEEIVLMVEMLIINHTGIKVMVTNISNLKEALFEDDLADVHGEADHMLDKHTVEANLLIKMTIVYHA